MVMSFTATHGINEPHIEVKKPGVSRAGVGISKVKSKYSTNLYHEKYYYHPYYNTSR